MCPAGLAHQQAVPGRTVRSWGAQWGTTERPSRPHRRRLQGLAAHARLRGDFLATVRRLMAGRSRRVCHSTRVFPRPLDSPPRAEAAALLLPPDMDDLSLPWRGLGAHAERASLAAWPRECDMELAAKARPPRRAQRLSSTNSAGTPHCACTFQAAATQGNASLQLPHHHATPCGHNRVPESESGADPGRWRLRSIGGCRFSSGSVLPSPCAHPRTWHLPRHLQWQTDHRPRRQRRSQGGAMAAFARCVSAAVLTRSRGCRNSAIVGHERRAPRGHVARGHAAARCD